MLVLRVIKRPNKTKTEAEQVKFKLVRPYYFSLVDWRARGANQV